MVVAAPSAFGALQAVALTGSAYVEVEMGTAWLAGYVCSPYVPATRLQTACHLEHNLSTLPAFLHPESCRLLCTHSSLPARQAVSMHDCHLLLQTL